MEKNSLLVSGVRCRSLSPQRLSEFEGSLKKTFCCGQDQGDKLGQLNDIVLEQGSADRLRLQRQKIEVLKVEFDRKVEELQSTKSENNGLKKEVQALAEIKGEYDLLVPEHDRLRYELERVKEERNQVAADLEAYEGEGYADELMAVKQELLSLRGEFDKALVTNSKYEKTIASLKIQQQDLEDGLNYQISHLKIKLETALEESSRAKRDAREARDELQVARVAQANQLKIRNDLELAVVRLKEKHDSQAEDSREKESLINCLRAELSKQGLDHHREVTELTSQLERRTLELHRRDSQLKEQLLKTEERESIIRLLEIDLGAAKDALEKADKERKKNEVEIGHLRASKATADATVASLKKEMQQREKKIVCLQNWKIQERQVRQDLGTLRLQARQHKQDEIERIDELINEIGFKHLGKRM